MNLTEQETAVLDYYRRENKGVIESEALAGLSLNTLRAARSRLVAKGALVVTAQGRYVPCGDDELRGVVTTVMSKEFTVNPGRGKVNIGRARVVSARLEDLADLDDGEAFREGFATKVEFVDAWAAINGSYDSEARVWRVEFEVTG
jgi:hypothetical protein